MVDGEKVFKEQEVLFDTVELTEAERKIGSMLAELKATMDTLKPALEQADEKKKEYANQISLKKREIDELSKASHEVDLITFDIRKQQRELEREMDVQRRLLEQANANKALADEYAALSDEFDRMTAGATWREWAFDHQISGGKRAAAAKRAILGDKRGLGKSLTSLIWLDMVQAKRVIAFVPNDTVDNFIREIKHWAPHRNVVKLAGLSKAHRQLVMETAMHLEETLFVINFEAWRKDLNLITLMENWQPDSVIIDEAHNVKDVKSIAFRGINRLLKADNKCPNCGAGADKLRVHFDSYTKVTTARSCSACEYEPSEFFQFNSVKCVLPMTGTPILNKPHDLFALLTLIDPIAFNDQRRFLDMYAEQDIYTKKWKFQYGGLDRLTKQLASKFIMRDRHSAGIVIPPQDIQYYAMEFDKEEYPEQWKVMETLNKHAAILLGSESEDGPNEILPVLYMIALITRKRQAIVWPAGIQLKNKEGMVMFNVSAYESIKLDKIIKRPNGDPEFSGLIPELVGIYDEDNHNGTGYDGERVVVFSQFKEPLKELEKRLQEANIPTVRYDGDTPADIRADAQIDFDAKFCNADDYQLKYQVILCNYKTGGVGLNFTGATQMIILDEEWNPGKADQAYGRIDRMGQTKETTVHVLRVKNSVDTWMAQLIQDKADMVEGFESTVNLQQEMYDAIMNGDML